MNRLSYSLQGLASLFSLLPSALCQIDPPIPPTQVVTDTIAWPGGHEWGNRGRFARTVAGYFTLLPGLDSAIQRDGRIFLVRAARTLGALLRVDDTLTGVKDIALLPGGGGDTRDAIAFLYAGGLAKASYVQSTDSFAIHTIDPAWTSATRLFSADIDGDGMANDLAMVVNDTVHTLLDGGVTPGNDYTFSSTVSDVAFPDYDWDGVPDVAAVVGNGVEVHGFTPTSGVFPNSQIERVPRGGALIGDYLAWSREDSRGGSWSVTLLHSGGQEGLVGVGTSVIGLVASDVNGDGMVDLSPYSTAEHRLPVYYNTGAAPFFSSNPVNWEKYDLEQPFTAPMPGNVAQPTLIPPRVDGDAYATFLYPMEDSNNIVRVTAPRDESELPASTVFGCSYSLDNYGGILHVFLDVGPSFPVGDYTHIRVIQWRQAAEYAPLDTIASTFTYYQIHNTAVDQFRTDVPIAELGSIWPTPGPLYYKLVTFVKLSGNKVLDESATILVGWRVRDTADETNKDYMDYLRNQNPDGVEYDYRGLGVIPPSGGVSVGGGVILYSTPSWYAGEEPTLPEPVYDVTVDW